MTGEAVLLPARDEPYWLQFNEGFATIVSGSETMKVSRYLTKTVFKSEKGFFVVEVVVDGDRSRKKAYSLDELITDRSDPVALKWAHSDTGGIACSVKHITAYLYGCKTGARTSLFYLSWKDLQMNLDLSVKTSRSHRWICQRRDKWIEHFAKYGLDKLVLCPHINGSTTEDLLLMWLLHRALLVELQKSLEMQKVR